MHNRYQIVRFYQEPVMRKTCIGESRSGSPIYGDRPTKREIIKICVSLEDAQEHCSREDTHEPGVWFDGYEEMREGFARPNVSGIQKVLAVNHTIKHGGSPFFNPLLHNNQ